MINFNATDNFMIKVLVKRKEYLTRKKSDVYNLMIVDENSLFDENERVDKETKSLSIAI